MTIRSISLFILTLTIISCVECVVIGRPRHDGSQMFVYPPFNMMPLTLGGGFGSPGSFGLIPIIFHPLMQKNTAKDFDKPKSDSESLSNRFFTFCIIIITTLLNAEQFKKLNWILMATEEQGNPHDQVFSFKFTSLLKWIYHKLHICMCTENPKRFISSQWPISPLNWLAYRIAIATVTTVLLAIHFTSEVLYNMKKPLNIARYFIFLTNWGMIILSVCFMAKAYIALKYFSFMTSGFELNHLPSSFKFTWIFTNVNNTLAFIVTIGYWAILYNGEWISTDHTIISHLMNLLITILEIFISKMPIYFGHCYQPLLLGWFYLLFTYIFYESGGTKDDGSRYIYSIVDWSKPGQTVLLNLIGGSFVGVILHASIVLASWTRSQIAQRIIKSK